MDMQDQSVQALDSRGAPRHAGREQAASTDWDELHSARRERPFMTVLIVVVIAGSFGLASQAYMEWRARVVMEQVDRRAQETFRATQLQAQQIQREVQMREAKWQTQRDQEEAQRVQAIQERQHAEDAAKRAAVEETRRREQAWAKFYHKPAACNDAATMACANSYIRAKRIFEEKFAHGEL